MDIFFVDPNDIPLPPEEVRIQQLTVDPYSDGKRVRLTLELTPFQQKPSGDIMISDLSGNSVASASFIEAITTKLEMTLHLKANESGEFTASAVLYYTSEIENDVEDGRVIMIPKQQIVDQVEVKFLFAGPDESVSALI